MAARYTKRSGARRLNHTIQGRLSYEIGRACLTSPELFGTLPKKLCVAAGEIRDRKPQASY